MHPSSGTEEESRTRPIALARRIAEAVEALGTHTTLLLRFACAAVFLGRAWQHIFIGPPYRPILFSQPMMEGLVLKVFGMDWTNWATSTVVESNLNLVTRIIGVVLVLCAVAAFAVDARRVWPRILLGIGALILSVIAFAVYRDKLLRIGELFELACAVSAPILLFLATKEKPASARFLRHWLTVAVAATFGAHGLYAVGYYPRPGEWVTMVMTILHLSEPAAVNVLIAAGILDFAIVLLIFTPGLGGWAAGYAALWGLLTAFARVAAHVSWENFSESGRYWIPETIIRFPNALLPLAILGFLFHRARSQPASCPITLSPCPATVDPTPHHTPHTPV